MLISKFSRMSEKNGNERKHNLTVGGIQFTKNKLKKKPNNKKVIIPENLQK